MRILIKVSFEENNMYTILTFMMIYDSAVLSPAILFVLN